MDLFLFAKLAITATGVIVVLMAARFYGSKSKLECPRCDSGSVRRSHRRNVFERILSVVPIHPFRCVDCGHRFMKIR
ncbi:MAG: hypothetical protein ACREQ7_10585 [Candidatus Binatia bacterium]